MGACTTKLDEKTLQQNSIVRANPINAAEPNRSALPSQIPTLNEPKTRTEDGMPSQINTNLNYFPDFYYFIRISGKLLSITKSSSTEVILKVSFSFPQECAIGYLKDKSIMLVGGMLKSVMVPVVALIYPSSNRAYELPYLPIPCKNGQIHEIGEWIYYVGGEAMGYKGLTQAPLMRFSFKLKLWQDLLKISEQFKFNRIVNMGSCAIGNKLLFVGGQRKSKSGELKNSKNIYSIAVEDDFKLELEAKLPIKILKPSIATGLKHGIIAGGINAKTNLPNRCCFCIIVKDQIYNVYQMEDLGFDLTEAYPSFYHKDYVMFISYPNLALRVKRVSNWIEYSITGKNTRVLNEINPGITKLNESQTSEESQRIEDASKSILSKNFSKGTDRKLLNNINKNTKLEAITSRRKRKIDNRNSANYELERDSIDPFISERPSEIVASSEIGLNIDRLKNDNSYDSDINIARNSLISLGQPAEQGFMLIQKFQTLNPYQDIDEFREVKHTTEKVHIPKISEDFSNEDPFYESPKHTPKKNQENPFIVHKKVDNARFDIPKFAPLPSSENNKAINPSFEEFKVGLKHHEIADAANNASSRESIQFTSVSNVSEVLQNPTEKLFIDHGKVDKHKDLDPDELEKQMINKELNPLASYEEGGKIDKPNTYGNILKFEDHNKMVKKLDKSYEEKNKTFEFSLNIQEKKPNDHFPELFSESKGDHLVDQEPPSNEANVGVHINPEFVNLDYLDNDDSKESKTSYDSSSSSRSHKFNSVTDFDKLRQMLKPPDIVLSGVKSNIENADTSKNLIQKEHIEIQNVDLLKFDDDDPPLRIDEKIPLPSPNYFELPKEIDRNERDEHLTKENTTPKLPSVLLFENKSEVIEKVASQLPKLKLEALNQKKVANPNQFDIDIHLIEIKKDEEEEPRKTKERNYELKGFHPSNVDNLEENLNKLEQRPSSRCLSTVTETVFLKPNESYAGDHSMNKSSSVQSLNVNARNRIPISLNSKMTSSIGTSSPIPINKQEQRKIKLSFDSENKPASPLIENQSIYGRMAEYSGRPNSNTIDKLDKGNGIPKVKEVMPLIKAPSIEFASEKPTENEFMDFEIVSGINFNKNSSIIEINNKPVQQERVDISPKSLLKDTESAYNKKIVVKQDIVEEMIPKTMPKTKSLGKIGLKKFKPFSLPQGIISTQDLKLRTEINKLNDYRPLTSEKSPDMRAKPLSIQRKGLYELPEMHEKLEIDKPDDEKGGEIQIHDNPFLDNQPGKRSQIDMKCLNIEILSKDNIQKFLSIIRTELKIPKESSVPYIKKYSELSKYLQNDLQSRTFFIRDFIAACSKIHELSGKKKLSSKQCYMIITKYGIKDDREAIPANIISRALCKALKIVFLKKS